MAKDRKFTIRIRDADIEFLESNLPPEIDNLSELFRVSAKNFIAAEKPVGSSTDLDSISKIIGESQDRIISEIHQSRSIVLAVQLALQRENLIGKEKLAAASIEEILRIWMEDPIALTRFGSVEELEKSVKYDHLVRYAIDAVMELKRRKMLTVTPGGKLIWNL